MLRGAIAHDERRRPQARAGGHVDDVSEPLAEHDRIGGLYAVDDTAQVDVQNAIPVLELVKADLAHNANPRVVEDVVQTSLTAERVLDQSLGRSEVGDIQPLGGSLPTGLSDAGSDFLSQLNLQVSQHDQRPSPCQRFAQRAADAGSAARDNGHRALEGPQ